MSLIAVLPEVDQFLATAQGHFINGHIETNTGPDAVTLYNPADGQVLHQLNGCTRADVDRAVANAHAAFMDRRWAGMRPADREKILFKLSELLRQHGEVLAQLETLNQGKSIHVSRDVEVNATAEYIRYMAGWATKLTGDTMDVSIAVPEHTQYTAYTRREPIGVVAAIAPWNFPLSIAAWKTLPALAAGCSVVLKPASETPLTALYLAKLAHEAGVPAGVFNVLMAADGSMGQALVEHPLISKVTFTGSTAVGKKVGHAAIAHMASFALELGGKNPMIIMDDVAVDQAINGIMMGGLLNSGQVCAAASRIYVQRGRYEAIKTALTQALQGLSIGPGLDEAAQIQPVASQKHQHSILAHIATAKAEGATVFSVPLNGHDQGYYVPPTLITDARPDSSIIQHEVFGPVLTLIPFDDVEEVIAAANASEFGLAASLWTNNLALTMNLLPRIQAGTVWVNTHVPLDPAMPFGGVKQSGIGREFGRASVESFTELKTVCIAH
ncbi:MAG: aldehyde dehydrogenase family protein [Neisseriaceae bacterium]|nr:aldehyde dehydrogenase family protein [Neisseriaceae bacterium]